MAEQTIRDLAPILEEEETLHVPIDWPGQATAESSSPSPLTRTFRALKEMATLKKPDCCTLEVYELTRHPVAPRVDHIDGCVCERTGTSKKPDDKALTRRYLGRWFEARCNEKDGLQHWYWNILVGLCMEWDMEISEGCSKPTFESVTGH